MIIPVPASRADGFEADWRDFLGALQPRQASADTASSWWHAALPGTRKPVLLREGEANPERYWQLFLRKRWQKAIAHVLQAAPRTVARACCPPYAGPGWVDAGLAAVLPPGSSAHAVMLYFGSRGPLQKVTVLHRGARTDDTWVSKIALRPSADATVDNEGTWLARLQDFRQLAGCVPSVGARGRLPSGRSYLTMRAMPMAPSPERYTERHARFLAELCRATLEWVDWPTSTHRHQLLEELQALRGRQADGGLSAALWRAWARLEADWPAGEPMPSCAVHGDFAPWNTSMTEDEGGVLQVFDWEYARPQGSPLHDCFHFQLIGAALDSARALPMRTLRETVLPEASRQLRRALPQRAGLDAEVVWFLRLYLVETLVFYLRHSDEAEPQHRIVTAYASLLSQLEAGGLA